MFEQVGAVPQPAQKKVSGLALAVDVGARVRALWD